MIRYDPLWRTLKAKNISQYRLIKDYGIDNRVVKTMILDTLCTILDCRIEDVVEFVPDNTK